MFILYHIGAFHRINGMPFYFLLLILFSWCPLFAKTIEVVANFPPDIAHLTSILAKRSIDAKVTASDLSHYGIGIHNHSSLEKFLHKWSLDFWRSIPVKNEVEKIFFFNLTNRFRRDFKLEYLPKDKLVLFMWEPPVVLPQM